MFFGLFTDVEMKHKPDGILVNGSNPAGVAQGVYDHKRKIDVSFTSLNVTFSVGKFRFLTALIFQLPVNSSELAVSNVKRPNLKRSKYGLSEAPYSNVGVKSPLNNGKMIARYLCVSAAFVYMTVCLLSATLLFNNIF